MRGTASVVLCAVVLALSGCGDIDSRSPTTATGVTAAMVSDVSLMPDVVCWNLQDAQDEIQRAGKFWSRSQDATGAGRHQIVDSNWLVVAQEPPAGAPIGDSDPLLYVVKYDEPNPCAPSTTQGTTSVTTTTTRPSATTTTIPPTHTSSLRTIAYSIVEERDVSFAGAVRISLRVVVEVGSTSDQIRALAQNLSLEYRASHEYQALIIFFYDWLDLAFDTATLGIWVDAPFGDWSRANEAERGDYSSFAVDEEIYEKDWTLRPSEQDVRLYLAFFEKLDELDPDFTNPQTDEEVAAAVAVDTGFTSGEVLAAVEAVLDWQENGR
jgi:hypothetical protein